MQNTHVYVGHTLNWFCTIENITKTEVKCRTPAISKEYQVGTAVDVVSATRLVILSKCTGNCKFTYIDTASSPALTAISTSSTSVTGTNTRSITLTGTNLIDSSNFADVSLTHTITKKVIAFSSTSATATSVSFDLTSAVPSGTYEVRVRNAIGGTNAMALEVKLDIGTKSWTGSGSTAGGILSFTNGGGYPTALDGVSFAFTITSGSTNYPVNMISCCSSNSMTFEIPPAADGTSFTLTMKGPVNTVTKTYTATTATTPTATLTSANSVTSGSNTIVFSASNSVGATIDNLKLVSTIDSTQTIAIPSGTWSVSGTGSSAVTTFTANLGSGSYKIEANTQNGYISIADTIGVQFPSGVSPSSQQMSFNGGTFTLNAANLAASSYITVNGLRGKAISTTPSAATYEVPAQVSALTQSTFNLKK